MNVLIVFRRGTDRMNTIGLESHKRESQVFIISDAGSLTERARAGSLARPEGPQAVRQLPQLHAESSGRCLAGLSADRATIDR